jgi:tetratricopeptide (TPR) repeat protein
MNIKIIGAVMSLLALTALAGCETGTGNSQAPAETKGTAGEIYAPDGNEGATVTVTPVGKALISVVAGFPARIHVGAVEGEYQQARLQPGDYILRVGSIDSDQGLNLNFKAEAGDYYALALTYAVNGTLYWTPVIVSGAPDGPIAADKDGLLVGKTQAEAVKLLTAGPATQNQTAQADALYQKGMKLLAARKPEPAFEAFSQSISAKPTARALTARASLAYTLGEALGEKSDWNGAEPFFKGAQADAENGIKLKPNSVRLWSIKTATHIMLNQHEQACSAMLKTCALGDCSILKQFPQCKASGS